MATGVKSSFARNSIVSWHLETSFDWHVEDDRLNADRLISDNSPAPRIKRNVGRRVRVAEDVVLISARDGDELDATHERVNDVQITRQPVDGQRDRLQQTYDRYLSSGPTAAQLSFVDLYQRYSRHNTVSSK